MKTSISLLFILVVEIANAQDVIIKANTTLSITNGTTFTIGNALTNDGTLVNNGSILIGGQWVNNGTYTPGTGSITFNSTAPVQVINHNAQAFNRLTISGGGTKQFLADIVINQELILTDGILESSNNAKIEFGSGAIFSGGSDASHIKGTVQRTGQGTLVFPTGNGQAYLPVELLNTPSGTTGIIRLHELASPTLTGNSTLATLSDKRYWELVVQDVILTQSKIKLPSRNESFNSLDNVVVAGSSVALGTYTSLEQSDFSGSPASGSVTSNLAPTTVFYTLASASTDATIKVYNAVSVFEDGKNDYLQIENISKYPQNTVSIFNRWGDRVFQVKGYDNNDRTKRFAGLSTAGNILPSGTYYYTVNPGDGSEAITGYLHLK
ncbi:MAG: gliding motility-associated C-terminal domain-containing protein [Cytophagales bacterium]|nr:gliding motility-associated C-terminal domain-containing protein [Cytophagales bacterium]